jgi:two-component system, chemotaxis family, chemotaxis protein CheY
MADVDISKLSFLVIDDEPFMLKLVTRLLEEFGAKTILSAENGAEGLEVLKASHGNIDLVICDLEMPTMNGFDFVRNLRPSPDILNPQVPVLILTGHAYQESLQEAVELGIHGFLAKPVSRAALESRIVSAVTSPPIDPKILNRG